MILWQPELGNSGLQKSVRSKDMSQTFKRFGDYDRQHRRPRIKPKIKKIMTKVLYAGEIKDWGSGVRNDGPEKQC